MIFVFFEQIVKNVRVLTDFIYTNAIGVKLDFRMLRGRGEKGPCTLYSIQLKLNLLLRRESNKQKQSKCCLKGVFQVADAAQLTRASLKCWSEKEEEEEAMLALPDHLESKSWTVTHTRYG